MSVFYPSARVQLAIRLEEFDDTGSLLARLETPVAETPPAARPTATAPSTATVEEASANLDAVNERIATVEGGEALVEGGFDITPERETEILGALRAEQEAILEGLGLGLEATSPEEEPPVVGGPAPDGRVVFGAIAPRSVQIERNGLRSADTATVELNYADVPFDPRLLRAAAIEITLGVVSAGDFERGIGGARREDGSLLSMVPRSTSLGGTDTRAGGTTRFVGWVDDWQLSLDGTDGDTIKLECRDLSALFFDTQLGTGSGVDLSLPIDQGVQAFVDSYRELRGLRVVYGRPGQVDPGNAPVPAEAVPQALRPRGGRTARAARSGDQNMNLWDHLTEVCARVGLLPVVYDYQLHIVEPRTYYTSRDVARRMVYGRNLAHLEFTRKLGGVKVPTIEVRCYDSTLGRTRWARYPASPGNEFGVFGTNDPPTTPRRANEPSVSGHAPTERIQTYLVRGVCDGQRLYQVARNLFEQIGRQEIEGNLETDDVASVDAPEGVVADILGLDTGDTVELLVSGTGPIPDTTGMTAAQIQGLSREARAAYFRRIGWSADVAQRFAELQDSTAAQTVFRVQNARLSFDVEQGLHTVVDFVNYITVREDASAVTPAGSVSSTVSLDDGVPAFVEAAVEGALPALADGLRAVVRDQLVLGDRAEAGLVSPDEFADRAAALDEALPNALDAVETGGTLE